MKRNVKRLFSLAILFISFSGAVFSQNKSEAEKKADYRAVVTQRADKIVKALALADTKKEDKVREIIAQQYIDLNAIHDKRNEEVKEIKQQNTDKEASSVAVKSLEDKANKKLAKLHKKYLARLNNNLSAQQVEQVKDGMTYGVLPITYKGYQEMLPNLTEDQKKQILAYLTEAREFAMDAESSEKKHAWFGKYKGKINNYLSAAGIDMNKAGKEWQERIKLQAGKGKEN